MTSEPWPMQGTPEDQRRRAMGDWQASAVAKGRGAAAPSRDGVNVGWCTCCRRETHFIAAGAWLREQYFCDRCRSIPRFRAVNFILDSYLAGWERLRIHEFLPANDFIKRHCGSYSSSSGDLETLPFADDTFDLFITQDVLEHVLRPERAVLEITRVLKPGGAHVFTLPKHKELRESRQRARVGHDGAIEHLLPPEYHGDPKENPSALVTWDFGGDFEARVWNWCGYPTTSYVTRDRSYGLDGEFLDVFVTRKVK